MSVREYVGARYVPLFADPLTWDATRTYEPLTVVLYQGNSYTSRQAVPANIDITNTTYWAQTGNYNAQIEQYRAEVEAYSDRIEDVEDGLTDEETARQNADTTLQTAIDDEETARQNADSALQTAINNEATARQNADALLATKVELQTATANMATQTYVNNAVAPKANTNDVKILMTKGNYLSGGKSIGFGDSNMEGTVTGYDNCLYKLICNKLGVSYDNRGVSSARFQDTYSNSIQTQIDNASADSDVDLVVLIGGINDFHYSGETAVDFRNDVSTAVQKCLNKFPNALILTIFDCGQQFPTAKYLRFVYYMRWVSTYYPSRRILNVPTFDLIGDRTTYFQNQNHWNSTGTEFLSRRAANIVMNNGQIGALNRFREVRNGIADLNGTSNMLVHTADFDPDNMTILHTVDMSINNPSGSATVAAGTTLFQIEAGFCGNMASADKIIRFPLIPINTQGASKNAILLQMQQYSNNYELRDFGNSTIVLRSASAISVSNLTYSYLDLYYTFIQAPVE